MSTTWYYLNTFTNEIEGVEVVKETPTMLELKRGRREHKHSRYRHYFPSTREALEYHIERERRNLDQMRLNLSALEDRLQRFEKELAETMQ